MTGSDDRIDPSFDPPPSFGPRQMRASLSSSLGRTGSRRADRSGRREPVIEPEEPPPVESVAPQEAPTAVPPNDETVADEVLAPAPEERAAARPAARRDERRSRGRRPQDGVERSPRATSGNTIVPPQTVAGRALVLVVAIMCFLAALAIGALSLVAEAARDWQSDIAREATIQVIPIDGKPIEARLVRALEIARATPGVAGARLVDEKEGAALLEPWLGSGLDLSSLPVPRLVVVDLRDPTTADLSGLTRRIAAEVPGATVDDHAVWAGRLRTMAGAMVLAGVGVVVLMLTAMVLSVVFATRAAMAGNREVIEVLHFVGAEDRFVAAQFQWHFLLLGLEGGGIGGAAAIVTFVVADLATRTGRADPFAEQAQALFGGISVGLGGHLAVVALVGVVAALTALTSRLTVLGHLGRLD
jgi:cell division transport system permease protein